MIQQIVKVDLLNCGRLLYQKEIFCGIGQSVFGFQYGNTWVVDWNHCDNQILLNRYGLYSVTDRYRDGFGYGGLICAI